MKRFKDYIRENIEDMHKNLTDESLNHYNNLENSIGNNGAYGDALVRYLQHSGPTNRDLRSGVTKTNSDILSHLTNNKTNYNFHSFRTENNVSPNNFKKGDIIHSKAYTSTTLDPNNADTFLRNDKNEEGTRFRIKVKKGTKGYYVNAHGNGDELGAESENEFLLHPNTKFKVAGNYKDKTGRNYVDLHVHSQED